MSGGTSTNSEIRPCMYSVSSSASMGWSVWSLCLRTSSESIRVAYIFHAAGRTQWTRLGPSQDHGTPLINLRNPHR
jgi:hypothetical protein